MDLVIDANILFSVLIKKGKTEEIIFEEDLHLFAPEFIFEEFDKYKEAISEKTERTNEDFDELMDILKKKIKTVPNEETAKYITEAEKISPDKNVRIFHPVFDWWQKANLFCMWKILSMLKNHLHLMRWNVTTCHPSMMGGF
ncbi:hypothetical protein HYU07_01090 [Candidatus Woesearchaeota archaeon]|nr:hypothetical protein [Candidatus Woesearchaeota archaeon]